MENGRDALVLAPASPCDSPRLGWGGAPGISALAVLMFILAPGPRSAASGSASTLCDEPERSYFSCATRNGKLIELCGGKTVEYRFGKPGKVELSYPKAASDAPLRFAHYTRPVVDRIEISFSADGAAYSLFDYAEGRKRSAGVRATLASGVEARGSAREQKKEVTIACQGPIVSRLGALAKILPCDKESALNLGSCP